MAKENFYFREIEKSWKGSWQFSASKSTIKELLLISQKEFEVVSSKKDSERFAEVEESLNVFENEYIEADYFQE
jgi:hypothetical protein